MLSKSFPGVKALDNVQLSVRPGTVHALMGKTVQEIYFDEVPFRHLQDGSGRDLSGWK